MGADHQQPFVRMGDGIALLESHLEIKTALAVDFTSSIADASG